MIGGDFMEIIYKEVYFDQYCESCKHNKTSEDDEPCAECLSYPSNVHSHKPINYEEEKNNS